MTTDTQGARVTATRTTLDHAGTAATESAIRVRALRKSYTDSEAVRGIDLDVRRGEIFAFLGPNGAGKTTTVEVLEGFRPRSGGDVSVLGVDPAQGTRSWRDRIGIVLQESAPDPGLTVRESLELYAGYYSEPRSVPETIALVGLAGKDSRQATSLSGGERRRLDFGLALIGDPELIFLDEPTTGFDPSARRTAWDVIENLRDLGKTIFLTTHYMDEAERLADRIAVIVAGQIVAQGTPLTSADATRHRAQSRSRPDRDSPRSSFPKASAIAPTRTQTAASGCTATPRSRTSPSSNDGREQMASSSRTSKLNGRPSRTPTWRSHNTRPKETTDDAPP